MAHNPAIMQAIEQLNYRVTVGDVAANIGLELNETQQGLLALASDAGGHLQVAESGDIAYEFPKNFRSILNNKYWQLRFKQWWQKVSKTLFYLLRISFGIVLILSIILMLAAIVVIFIAMNSSRDGDDGDNRSSGGSFNFFYLPRFWFGPDIFWWFNPGYNSYYQRQPRHKGSSEKPKMSFLEAIFSFLFGDGDPNWNLEERRWHDIGVTIRNNGGAVIAEQIAPYMDDLDKNSNAYEYEEYLLPVLARFNGYPEVSPQGGIIYHFPELQVSASKQKQKSVSSYLKELPWRFSEATSGQTMFAVILGSANFILALVLGSMLRSPDLAIQSIGLIAFVNSIYWFLLGYGIAFLGIPLIRYFLLQRKNSRIEKRSLQRQELAIALNEATPQLQKKLAFARKFAANKAITQNDLAYSTEKDLLEQDLEQADKIDAEWQRRLNEGS
ncbi:MAG: hypothetical protein WA865_17900 [Spirulinaceae cyanobacterium]